MPSNVKKKRRFFPFLNKTLYRSFVHNLQTHALKTYFTLKTYDKVILKNEIKIKKF